jgi:MarR family transcriptional regulator, lower aerobic nicotinate degradation pathway regulator
MDDSAVRPPERLRRLVSWQSSKLSTIGARLTARRMPLGARGDFAVLAALDEYGPLSQADLGRRLGLDRNDVNGIVNRLQAAAHIDRQPDPGDRRRNVVTLTGDGVHRLEQLQAYADAVQDELLQALTDAERGALQDLLAKLLAGHAPQSA